ncbi:hypothetical protein QQS21_008616 [Conoideocrella luteorostrata]|uniref:MADS-box domain-containing protein n=1 Tax=Conoideocrella luteorostrata TaxID=1105319 RepID=A0AAJ0CKX0_9HYPO|nr:hypothetical protein QQS21_008616 [Conoideocrella luteorostrata]
MPRMHKATKAPKAPKAPRAPRTPGTPRKSRSKVNTRPEVSIGNRQWGICTKANALFRLYNVDVAVIMRKPDGTVAGYESNPSLVDVDGLTSKSRSKVVGRATSSSRSSSSMSQLTMDITWDITWDLPWNSTGDSTEDSTEDSIGDSTGDSTKGSIGDLNEDTAGDSIGDTVGDAVRNIIFDLLIRGIMAEANSNDSPWGWTIGCTPSADYEEEFLEGLINHVTDVEMELSTQTSVSLESICPTNAVKPAAKVKTQHNVH